MPDSPSNEPHRAEQGCSTITIDAGFAHAHWKFSGTYPRTSLARGNGEKCQVGHYLKVIRAVMRGMMKMGMRMRDSG